MIRMLLIGYCYGIRSERRLCEEVELNLAYRWFCRLDLDEEIPHHSTPSANRLGRFRDSDVLRHIFERIVHAAMATGLVKGEGFAVDASALEANASRYNGKALDELEALRLEVETGFGALDQERLVSRLASLFCRVKRTHIVFMARSATRMEGSRWPTPLASSICCTPCMCALRQKWTRSLVRSGACGMDCSRLD
jgi:hypothetical protein